METGMYSDKHIGQMPEYKRFDFIDSLRGVAMILVIKGHITGFWGGASSPLNDWIFCWRLPMFFFLSGFLAFTPIYNGSLMKRRIKNRLTMQLYPTIIVWLLYIYSGWLLSESSLREHLLAGVYSSEKLGYWFTFSLVQVFVFYALFAFSLQYFRISASRQTIIYLVATAVLCILSCCKIDDTAMSDSQRWLWHVLSVDKALRYSVFFLLGVLARRHLDRISTVMRNSLFAVSCLAVCVIFMILAGDDHYSVYYFIARISGIMFMLSLFACMEIYFDRNHALGRYLSRIGKNTLPVYLFHFFILLFVPVLFENVSEFIGRISANPFIEFFAITAIAMIFAEVTLAIDSMLKKIPYAHKVVFAKQA